MILVASYSTALGGAERLLVEFASGLDGECWLACPPGPLAEAARRAGLPVLPVRARSLQLRASPVSASRHLAGFGWELRRLARDLRPEVLVAWSMRSLLACALVRVQAPVVFQHNDLLPGPVVGALVRRAARRSRLVLACSRAAARELDPAGKLGGRLRVVHPGLEVDAFAAGPDARSAGGPVVLVLGALVPLKRPDFALDAFAHLRRRRPDAVLRLVGAAGEGAEGFVASLQQRARNLFGPDAVQFAGQVEDVRGELGRATCLLHCAEREAFGRVVLEALAAGRPVVVPAGNSGVAEIVDPSCALAYAPDDAQAAAEALERLLGDPELAARMGEAGRVRARSSFDRGAAQRQWAAEVRSVARCLAGRAPRTDRVAIVTVTYNSAARLEALLASVDRHLPEARVVVVDCASSDESVAIAERRPGTVAVPLSANVGFGRACNRGVSAVEAPVTLLLNPDVELLDDSLLELVEEAVRRDRPERLLAPLVLSPDGSRQDTVHPVPVSPADLARSLVPPAVFPAPGLAPWRGAFPTRVGWAVGCALVARTETLRRLGPFDERLFLYGEDLDLGLRAAAAGITTWFWPTARVLHHRGHATEPAFGGEPFEQLAAARREVISRRLGERRARVDDVAQGVTFASRIAAKRLLGQSTDRERQQLAALRSLRR